MDAPLLAIENLRTYFYSRARRAFIRSVDGVSLHVAPGETLGIVGESGSGKSVTALSAAGLVSAAPGVIGGRIELRSRQARRNLLDGLERYVRVKERDGRITAVEKDDRGWRRRAETLMEGVRGKEIAMIFQNPRSALNPYSTIGAQLVETIRLHTSVKGEGEARERAIHWLERVRIDSPRLRFDNFPFGMSGGMCQRAMIAMALSAEPSLPIAGEPATALDAANQPHTVQMRAPVTRCAAGCTLRRGKHEPHYSRRHRPAQGLQPASRPDLDAGRPAARDPGGGRRELLSQGERDRGPGRGIRLRQDHHRAHGAAPDRPEQRAHRI